MITAYLKPTNFCNVGCSHCYLPESVRADKFKMDDETLHKVMRFLKDMKEQGKHEQIFLIWHGGEPLILGHKYFEHAGEIIDQYFTKDEIIESVQTSLIPYRAEFNNLVKTRWGGYIGSSMDFNSRLLKGSAQDYQDLWMSKVNIARQAGIYIIPGITPNKVDCKNAKEIYSWFKQRGFDVWNIDRYSNVGGDLPDFSTNREHSQFLIDLFDLCVKDIKENNYAPLIKPVAAAIGGILYDMPGDRWGGTCQSDFVVINPNGSLNNCPDKDSFEASYGSLHDGFKSFKNSPMRKKWIRIQQVGHRIDECATCENASWCKSGCPITGNACAIGNERDDCSGFKTYINHVRNFIEQSPENKEIALGIFEGRFLDGLKKEDFNKVLPVSS